MAHVIEESVTAMCVVPRMLTEHRSTFTDADHVCSVGVAAEMAVAVVIHAGTQLVADEECPGPLMPSRCSLLMEVGGRLTGA